MASQLALPFVLGFVAGAIELAVWFFTRTTNTLGIALWTLMWSVYGYVVVKRRFSADKV